MTDADETKNTHATSALLEFGKYGFSVALPWSYERALESVTEALKSEGFGVLTEIDVRETLKQKLDVDFPRYVILGACNPPLAYQALQTEPDIGLLLPCNVVVHEVSGGTGGTGGARTARVARVAFVDPTTMMSVTTNPNLEAIAAEARTRLERVAGRLKNEATWER